MSLNADGTRNIHFDELPQIFNILKGDMSLVGPRPERQVLMREYCREIPEFYYRLKVKAGLTGYALVFIQKYGKDRLNEVPGVFEKADKADGFVEITSLKPGHRTSIAAECCEECRMLVIGY